MSGRGAEVRPLGLTAVGFSATACFLAGPGFVGPAFPMSLTLDLAFQASIRPCLPICFGRLAPICDPNALKSTGRVYWGGLAASSAVELAAGPQCPGLQPRAQALVATRDRELNDQLAAGGRPPMCWPLPPRTPTFGIAGGPDPPTACEMELEPLELR